MKIYIVGISCVGKTTIGRLLANKIEYSFYDLDTEVEKFYNKSIERIQNECLTMNGYRQKASAVLEKLLNRNECSVIAGTQSGLKYSYLQVYKRYKKENELVSIHLIDKPENVLKRITFYDIDSKLMEIELDENDKKKYLKEIISDFNFFKKSLNQADLLIDIDKIPLSQIPDLIITELNKIHKKIMPFENSL